MTSVQMERMKWKKGKNKGAGRKILKVSEKEEHQKIIIIPNTTDDIISTYANTQYHRKHWNYTHTRIYEHILVN